MSFEETKANIEKSIVQGTVLRVPSQTGQTILVPPLSISFVQMFDHKIDIHLYSGVCLTFYSSVVSEKDTSKIYGVDYVV